MELSDRQLQFAYLGIGTKCADCAPGNHKCNIRCTEEEYCFTEALLPSIEGVKADKRFMDYIKNL